MMGMQGWHSACGAREEVGRLTVSTRPTTDFLQTQSSSVAQCMCRTKALSALGGVLEKGMPSFWGQAMCSSMRQTLPFGCTMVACGVRKRTWWAGLMKDFTTPPALAKLPRS
jgi:hypothetical protein